MMIAPKPDNEQQRLQALRAYQILDTEAEAAFDALTRLASNICNTPISLVSLIDSDRQWFKSSVGLPGVSETSRDIAFCAHAILQQDILEVSDALDDPRFQDNPLVLSAPSIRFYAGAPLIDTDGHGLGTLCVIDTKPGQLNESQRQALRDLAQAAVGLIQARLDIRHARQINEIQAAARDAAEAASRAKSDFVANMSHEIRTPINAILGMTHLLENAHLASDRRRYRAMIREASESLLAILNDILDFSKIEAGKMELENKPFVLEEVLASVATIMSVSAGNKPVELCIDVLPGVAAVVSGDRTRLQQVLVNLVSNALKFTEAGEVLLRVQTVAEGTQLQFDVQDTGIGIDADTQKKLFSAFTQADSSTTRRFGGTGLGLAICRRLVELLGGEIGLDSRLGQGSRFWFRLPLAAVEQEPRPALVETPGCVLLVDDAPNSQQAISRLLLSASWQVQVAENTGAARALCQAHAGQAPPYDLLVYDAGLADNTDFVRLLNCWPKARQPAVILVRNNSCAELSGLDAQPCVRAIVSKPLTRTRLNDAIKEARTSPAPAPGREAATDIRSTPQARLDHLRILLVEDNPLNQIVGRGILEEAGAQVVIAAHGQQAVDLLQQRPDAFDVVLMDIQMPVMDGLAATRHIRQDLQLQLPVLAMTASVLREERERCMAAGMNDFIAKPIKVDQMLSVLRQYTPSVPDSEFIVEPAVVLSPSGIAIPAEPGEAAAAGAAPASEVLDLDGLVAGMGDNPAFVAAIAQLVHQLQKNGRPLVTSVNALWRDQQRREAMALLHKMRGGIGTLGALRLSALTVRLEQAMGEERDADVEAWLPELEQEMQAVLTAADDWLHQRGLDSLDKTDIQ